MDDAIHGDTEWPVIEWGLLEDIHDENNQDNSLAWYHLCINEQCSKSWKWGLCGGIHDKNNYDNCLAWYNGYLCSFMG